MSSSDRVNIQTQLVSPPPLLCGSYEPPCFKSWHGCSLNFTSAIPAFYQDNSFQKTIRLRHKLAQARFKLVKKHLIAKARIERVKIQQESEALARDRRFKQQKIESTLRATIASLHAAATRIQKVVRGWLCRKRLDRDFITRERTTTLQQVKSLEEFTHWWYMSTEKQVAEKVRIVQKAYRRYRRLKMIAVMARAYAILQEREECGNALILTSVFRHFLASLQFHSAMVELTRDANLMKIRRKLACLRIGVLWRRLGLTLKIVRIKIRRFVRKVRTRRKTGKVSSPRKSGQIVDWDSPGVSISNFTSPKGDAYLSVDSGLLDDTGELPNRSIYSSMRSTSSHNEGDRTKVGLKMNALGFHPPKDIMLYPVLEKRRLESPGLGSQTPENVFTRLLATTECSNQRSATSHSHRPEFLHRRTATTTPSGMQGLRGSAGSTPVHDVRVRSSSRNRHRYMEATENFNIALECRAEEEPPRRHSPSHWHPKGNVFGQTVSWTKKRRTKSRLPSSKLSWRPFFATSDPEYIVSLDNPTYQGKPFSALPYKREAFQRPQTSAVETRIEIKSQEEEAPPNPFLRTFRNLTPMLFSGGDMPATDHFSSL